MQKLVFKRKCKKFGGPSFRFFQTDSRGWFFCESIKKFLKNIKKNLVRLAFQENIRNFQQNIRSLSWVGFFGKV